MPSAPGIRAVAVKRLVRGERDDVDLEGAVQADEPIDRVRAAFGHDSFARLQALKSRYDPDNALRRNQNIPPAA